MIKVLSVFGTRPEAIKMAPVVRALSGQPDRILSRVCVTAQHRQMLDQVLRLFDIQPDHDLDLMQAGQTPTQVASAVLAQIEPVLQAEQPDWVLIQGDTTTVMAVSIAAFLARVRIGHVEAGLRTFDKWQPFPEEVNRRIAGMLADLHFAPTEWARQNLLREGVPEAQVLVTGNPVIDALNWVVQQPFDEDSFSGAEYGRLRGLLDRDDGRKLILVTAHRRESFGRPLERICLALKEIAEHYGDRVCIVYPVHLNPNVQQPVRRLLGELPNVVLTPPLDYHPLVTLMKRAHLVLTDSGGIQEEAPGLGKPVLVLREITERPEGIKAGTVRLVGTDTDRIVEQTRRLLEDAEAYRRMAQAVNPYGDGRAAPRIVEALLDWGDQGASL